MQKFILCAVATIIMLNLQNADCMREPVASTADSFISKPLSEWPTVNPISTPEEMRIYKTTWDSTKTLAENQERLLGSFIETCVDFTFKAKKSKETSAAYGETSSGEQIVAFDEKEFLIKCDISELSKCLNSTAMACTDAQLYDFSDELKTQIIGYLTTLIEHPIGCKLLRIMLAKYKANHLPKIIFIPTGSENVSSFLYHKSHYLGEAIEDREFQILTMNYTIRSFFRQSTPHPKKSNFILFPFNESDRFIQTYALTKNRDEDTDFLFDIKVLPVDAILLHEMLHSISETLGTTKTDVIERRLDERLERQECVSISVRDNESCYRVSESPIDLWKRFYSDDEEYAIMFGIRYQAINLLNESAYLAQRYGFIRIAHFSLKTTLNISDSDKAFSQEQTQELLEKLTAQYGDMDLYKFYLYTDSSVRYPRFGIGQYQSSDLDPTTGMKKITQQ